MADNSGVAYKDLLPVPDTEAISDPAKEEAARAIHDGATASHELATAPTEETGLVQQDHDEEVKDLGWNEPKEAIPAPLVGGMDNEDLWVLVRRFDKVRFPYVANFRMSRKLTGFSSKCTMLRNIRTPFRTISISILPTKMSSRLISFAPALSDCI